MLPERHQQSSSAVCQSGPRKIRPARAERKHANSLFAHRPKMQVFDVSGHWMVVLVGPGHDSDDARGERPTRENKRFRIATASETAFYSRKAALRGHLVVLVASGETPADLCCCLSKRTHENPAGEGGAKTCKFFVCPSSKNASFCSGRPLVVLVGSGESPAELCRN